MLDQLKNFAASSPSRFGPGYAYKVYITFVYVLAVCSFAGIHGMRPVFHY